MQRWVWLALRQAHLWLGLSLAVWLLLASTTGSALLFAPQLKALTAPSCPHGAPRAPGEALAAIDTAFPGQVRATTLASPGLCFHEVRLRNGGGAYVDPASLQVVRRWKRDGRLTDLVLDVHRQLLLQEAGKPVVAGLAVAAVILAVAGLALALRRPKRLSLRLWPRSLTAAALLTSHRNLGVVLAAPLLFMAASGLVMSYPKETQTLLAEALGDQAPRRPPPPPKRSNHHGRPSEDDRRRDWGAALAAAEAAAPGRPIRLVTWPDHPGGPVGVRFRGGREDQAVSVNPGGRVSAAPQERGDGRAARIVRALHDLHSGRLPPGAGSVVLLAVALLFAASSIAGVWSYAARSAASPGRRLAERKPAARPDQTHPQRTRIQ